MMNDGQAQPLSGGPRRQPRAFSALVTFSLLTVVYMIDKGLMGSLKEPIKRDLGLSDAQTANPVLAQTLLYMIAGPIVGWLTDKVGLDSKRVLMCFYVFWSIATAAAGFASSLSGLVVARACVGAGEAAFTVIMWVVVADFYPLEDRVAVYTVLGLAMPVGQAVGFAVTAVFEPLCGWQGTCFVCGFPGLALTYVLYYIPFPEPGCNDAGPEDTAATHPSKDEAYLKSVWLVFTNGHWLLSTLGQAAISFYLAGMQDWAIPFFSRYSSLSNSGANVMVGVIALVGGVAGNILGQKLVQYFDTRIKNSIMIVPTCLTYVGGVCWMCSINLIGYGFFIAGSILGILANIFVCASMPTLLSFCINVVPTHLRKTSSGCYVIITNVLGNLIAPSLVGAISDHSGSLLLAVQMLWMAVFVGAAYWTIMLGCLSSVDDVIYKNAPIRDDKEQSRQNSISSLFSGDVSSDPQTDQDYGTVNGKRV